MKDGEKVDRTLWVRIVARWDLAERAVCDLKKGDQVSLIGELDRRDWDKDGEEWHMLDVVANHLELVDMSGVGNGSGRDYSDEEAPPYSGCQDSATPGGRQDSANPSGRHDSATRDDDIPF